ncbi:acyl-CoA thioesterase domain-containing protein [Nocardia tengchongensis]|uniref:acyl-CoA thioesterase domain-containing protein n=2 Tax=Nocardia tengchongensis TaxID=2055889 RepID=UPI003692A579
MSQAEDSATGYFDIQGDGFIPLEAARGPWGQDTIGGQGLTALVARELERGCPFEAAGCRLTIDFVKMTTFDSISARAKLVRSSTRVALVHLELAQSDQVVVRASGLFIRPRDDDRAAGRAWTPAAEFSRPDAVDSEGDTPPPMLSSADHPHDWSADFADHRNNARKRMWTRTMLPAVRGEKATPFIRVATLAEATSFITNWDGDSVPFINVDVTMNLFRMPESDGLGLESNGQHAADGIAIGSANLYDEYGTLGVSSVTAVANTQQQVHF